VRWLKAEKKIVIKMLNVVITGGCNGLGGAIVDILHRTDVLLTVIGRQSPSNKRANDCFVELDLSEDISGWKYNNFKFVSKVLFISNAGIIDPIGSTSEVLKKDLENNHNVNFYSPFLIASELSTKTKIRNIKLHIANISSGAASRALPKWAAYCSSKAAIKIAYDCLALENDHVTVEHINPGVLNTTMQQKIRNSESGLVPEERIFSNLRTNGGLLEPQVAAQKIIDKLIGP